MSEDPEVIQVEDDSLTTKVKDLIKEGNVRRIVIKNADGESVLEVPVTAAVLGTVILPAVVAVGAIAGLSKNWTLEVYRKDD
jgi:hypothetical protein